MTMTVEPTLPPISEEASVLYPVTFRGIRLTTIFFSSLAGGILVARNWRRLGKPGLYWPTLMGSFLLQLLIATLFGVIYLVYLTPKDLGGLNIPIWLVNLLVAQLFIKWQRKDYNAWIAAHPTLTFPRRKSQRAIYIWAMVSAILIGNGASAFVALLYTPFLEAALPAQSYSAGGVMLTYPGNWSSVLLSDTPRSVQNVCSETHVTCLLYLRRSDAQAVLLLARRVSNTESLSDVDSSVWKDVTTKGTVIPDSLDTLQVDGHDALQRTFVGLIQNGTLRQINTFIKEDSGNILVIQATMVVSVNTGTYNKEIASIVGSLHLTSDVVATSAAPLGTENAAKGSSQ